MHSTFKNLIKEIRVHLSRVQNYFSYSYNCRLLQLRMDPDIPKFLTLPMDRKIAMAYLVTPQLKISLNDLRASHDFGESSLRFTCVGHEYSPSIVTRGEGSVIGASHDFIRMMDC